MIKRILISITGKNRKDWKSKLEEIEALKIKEVCLFLEFYDKEKREEIYRALLNSKIKSIPLVHIRHDMIKEELKFLKHQYKTKYFTIHEINFEQDDLLKWKGFYKNLCLEMNFDNYVSSKVKVEKIDGFCIDLAHFKVAKEMQNKDFEYVFNKRKFKKYFDCNHLNGWDKKTNCDMHTINSLKDFDYLKTLPNFLFGKVIALEVFNSIKEQLEFKKYLIEVLNKNNS
ncbi:MAG: hypothetical protein PHH88_01895 [Candidatus Pacebacteria bacterium]|nr:hypothetical protein [Candidatus Paceibacterota bacterium]